MAFRFEDLVPAAEMLSGHADLAPPPAAPDGFQFDADALTVKQQFARFMLEFRRQPASAGGDDSVLMSSISHSASQVPEPFSPYLMELFTRASASSSSARGGGRDAESELSFLLISYPELKAFLGPVCDWILAHWLRVEPYLGAACRELVHDSRYRQQAGVEAGARGSRRYHVGLCHLHASCGIRDLHTRTVGSLMAIKGTVTRSSQVRPELLTASFRCLEPACQTLVPAVHQQFRYTPPLRCLNPSCNNRSRWQLELTDSGTLFVDWQSLKLQESAADIPAGSMPRSIRLVLRDAMVETVKPGDKVEATGCLIVVPEVGMLGSRGVQLTADAREAAGRPQQQSGSAARQPGVRGLRELGVRELNYSLCFLVSHIALATPDLTQELTDRQRSGEEIGFDSFVASLPQAQRERLRQMQSTPRLYTRLVQSLATSVHGHEEIKRGLLLMLLGGVHKRTADGASLRGDINVCIVGDPSTSKSQFLKYVCAFLPRAVYTSGKASSAAGLTASVVKDVETGEYGIEAGALMLADNGICCIDEFDKMELTDQVAIHEAMEQQTISIAKAGIQATLNARTSVLAAANPIKGRYDRTRTLKQNVDISAPIMSRFDLFFVVLDEQDEAVDFAIAQHIIDVHCSAGSATAAAGGGGGGSSSALFSMEDLQLYVRAARTLRPKLTAPAQQYLIDAYVLLRTNDSVGVNRSSYRITVRQLESMVRLSEARARLDLSSTVEVRHVKEAARLLKKSIVRVETGDVMLEEEMEAEGDDDGQHEEDGDKDWEEEKKEAPPSPAPSSSSPPPPSPSPPASQPRRKVQLKVSEYNALSLELRHLLRQWETAASNPYRPNSKQSHLINALLSRHEAEMQQRDVDEERRRLRMIVQLVINDGKVLVVKPTAEDRQRLDREDEEEEQRGGQREEKAMRRLLLCHPNFDGEDETTAGKTGRARGYGVIRGAEDDATTTTAPQPLSELKEEKEPEEGKDEDREDTGDEKESGAAVRAVQRVDSGGSVDAGSRRKRARAARGGSPVVRGSPATRTPPAPLTPPTPSTPQTPASTRSTRSRAARRGAPQS